MYTCDLILLCHLFLPLNIITFSKYYSHFLHTCRFNSFAYFSPHIDRCWSALYTSLLQRNLVCNERLRWPKLLNKQNSELEWANIRIVRFCCCYEWYFVYQKVYVPVCMRNITLNYFFDVCCCFISLCDFCFQVLCFARVLKLMLTQIYSPRSSR